MPRCENHTSRGSPRSLTNKLGFISLREGTCFDAADGHFTKVTRLQNTENHFHMCNFCESCNKLLNVVQMKPQFANTLLHDKSVLHRIRCLLCTINTGEEDFYISVKSPNHLRSCACEWLFTELVQDTGREWIPKFLRRLVNCSGTEPADKIKENMHILVKILCCLFFVSKFEIMCTNAGTTCDFTD